MAETKIACRAVVLHPNKDAIYLTTEEAEHKEGELNLPGGRRDPGESRLDCVIRETLEETNLLIQPTGLIREYHSKDPKYPWTQFIYSALLIGRREGAEPELGGGFYPYDIIRNYYWRMNLRSPIVLDAIHRSRAIDSESLAMITELEQFQRVAHDLDYSEVALAA